MVAIPLSAVTHGVGAAGFLVLAVIVMAGVRRSAPGLWLLTACLATILWHGVAMLDAFRGERLADYARMALALRSFCWFGFLAAAVSQPGIGHQMGGIARQLPRAAMAAAAAMAAWVGASAAGLLPRIAEDDGIALWSITWLGVAVAGLVVLENLYRTASREQRWHLKFLCFGLGAIFAYDFLLYSDALLFRTIDPSLRAARPLANVLVVPLLAVAAARNRDWRLDVAVSRSTVFHTTSLVGAGLYLLAMASAGYYVREFGGDWGAVLQVVLLFAALIGLVVGASSARIRSRVRVFVSKHFFTYKYDYRQIWLDFVERLAAGERRVGLGERVLEAVGELVDSPDGALWLRAEDGRFAHTAGRNVGSWGLAGAAHATEAADGPLAAFLRRTGFVVQIPEIDRRPELYEGFRLPEWLAEMPRAWLIVPLRLNEELLGFMVLGTPRAPRSLNWEDFDLLKTAARQAASYLAEDAATRALAEAREFEAFNRRFAFVLHDIKNLVSQLSILVANAEKHGDKPEFRRDMVETVRESVSKMTRLLARLHQEDQAAAAERQRGTVRMGPFLRDLLRRWDGHDPAIRFQATGDAAVTADPDQLGMVVAHLVQNALDAAPRQGGTVNVLLSGNGDRVVLEVVDNGPGMTPEFVRDELFKPFRSTKSGGFGIGAYESRTIARQLGGDLEVLSAKGQGTTMRLTLPAAPGANGVNDAG